MDAHDASIDAGHCSKNDYDGGNSVHTGMRVAALRADTRCARISRWGSYGTTNSIGVVWPPNGAPIVVVLYYTQQEKDGDARSEVLAGATRTIVSALN